MSDGDSDLITFLHGVYATNIGSAASPGAGFLTGLTWSSIHIREVAKEALRLNTAAIIFTHNHPSGDCNPSHADIRITTELQKALDIFDIRVLDHLIVSVEGCASLAERGIL